MDSVTPAEMSHGEQSAGKCPSCSPAPTQTEPASLPKPGRGAGSEVARGWRVSKGEREGAMEKRQGKEPESWQDDHGGSSIAADPGAQLPIGSLVQLEQDLCSVHINCTSLPRV